MPDGVIIAIGRSGNHRKLGCSGEDLDKVYNRLYDPKDFEGKEVLVVGAEIARSNVRSRSPVPERKLP